MFLKDSFHPFILWCRIVDQLKYNRNEIVMAGAFVLGLEHVLEAKGSIADVFVYNRRTCARFRSIIFRSMR